MRYGLLVVGLLMATEPALAGGCRSAPSGETAADLQLARILYRADCASRPAIIESQRLAVNQQIYARYHRRGIVATLPAAEEIPPPPQSSGSEVPPPPRSNGVDALPAGRRGF
jgi:hypothetical protein